MALKLNCPHCKQEFQAALQAEIPGQQKLYSEITYESERLVAETVGGVITDMAKLLIQIAKDMGGKVQVFVDSVEYGDHKLKVGYLVLDVKEASK